MIKEVEYEFPEGKIQDETTWNFFTKSTQMWLRPFSQEINATAGKLVLIFYRNGENKFRVDGIDDKLKKRIAEWYPNFAEF